MFGLLHLPPLPLRALDLPQAAQQVQQTYASGLRVRGNRYVISADNLTVEWTGSVEATFGPSKLTADRLVLNQNETNPFGEASGNVRLEDPEGTITAESLRLNWLTKTGSGSRVVVRVASLRLEAESIEISPDQWTLRNVGGTGCELKTPVYYIRTRELRIRPDEGVRAVRPGLSLFGKKIITLPDQSFSFSGGGGSIDLPYPTYRSERGFGLNWSPGFALGATTNLFARYAVYEKSLPFYSATLMHSFLKGRSPEVVRTEIGDRLGFGYFDSVQVRTPEAEQQYVKKPRFDLGVGTTFGADGRDTTTVSEKINKPIEVFGQASGAFGGFGVFGLARAQQVNVGGGPKLERLILEQNVVSPLVPIGTGVHLYGRIDAAQFLGGNDYGWIRGSAGITFQPVRNIRVGAAYTAARAHGTPDFAYDAPFRFRELNLRTDFDFDTTQLRLLVKIDPTNREIFDREVYFSQVIGCLEPFIVYRERPRKFFVGIKLPLYRAFERLSRAEIERRAAIRNVISGNE